MRLSEPAPAKLNLALHVRGKLPDGRHALELRQTTAPEPLITRLAAAGGRVVSLTPLHPTLEEYFVQQVTGPGEGPPGTGGPQ